MKTELRAAIEENYGIRIASCADGPRGQVSTETYVLKDDRGREYFCKLTGRPDFISIILPTLPVLREMKDKGAACIAAPVPARSGLSVLAGGTLAVLFDFAPGRQGYDYDLRAFGQALGGIHSLASRLEARLPARGFASFRENFLTEELPRLGSAQTGDSVRLALRDVLQKHGDETRAVIDAFFRLKKTCGDRPFTFVNSHGDIHGNVLIQSPQEFCIIDWDELENGPAERDLWLLSEKPEFMEGYRLARPGFAPDADALKHAVLKNYLEGIPIYLHAILDESRPPAARLEHLQKLEAKRFNGWMKPRVLAAMQK